MKRLLRATTLALMLVGLAVGLTAATVTVSLDDVPVDQLRARVQEVLYWEAVCAPQQPVLIPGGLDCVEPRDGWVPLSQQDSFDDLLRYIDARD